ncbi:hypothetical protein [Frisingicoccus sp.]|uniref:hypothetical protein n=1 Tax=Frisingicoccus sp. TaxID=1918627 RepID=UPI003AB4D601
MNDLKRLCKELEKCKIRENYHTEEIICARTKVQDYVGNDSNKFLKLKVLVRTYDDKGKDFTLTLVVLSIFTFMASAFLNVCGGNSITCQALLLLYMITLAVFYIYNLISNIYKQMDYEWVKYIEIVLEGINISDLQ